MRFRETRPAWRQPGLLTRWTTRLSASPAFQRLAFLTPGLRGVAGRRARALFDLMAGFVHTQVLTACVRLELFRRLAERPLTAAEVATLADVAPEAAERLLDAAVALDLLWRGRDGRYRPGRLSGPLQGDGGGVAAMIAHHGALYADLADPLAWLRGWPATPTALRSFWAYAGEAADGEVEAYSRLMTASQDMAAADVLDAWGRPQGPWLDIGGGEGGFLMEVARRAPGLSGLVLDLPAVAARANARFAKLGLSDRLAARGEDLLQAGEPCGAPGDFATVSLVRVLHDHGDDDALTILRRARRALRPGGLLLAAEPMRGPPGDARINDAYFGPYLLAMGPGKLRTAERLVALAAQAGFRRAVELKTRRPFLARALKLS